MWRQAVDALAPQFDVALRGELLEGFAHRCARGAVLGGERLFVELHARRELARNDIVFDRGTDVQHAGFRFVRLDLKRGNRWNLRRGGF